MAENQVFRVNSVEEETAFRNAVHQVIACILAEKPGRTLIDIAERIDVSVRTISNAFNKTHSLSYTYVNRLGCAYGSHCLDPIAALTGARMVPIEADQDAEALPSTSAAVHKLAVAGSRNSPGGERLTHQELLDMEPEIDAAIKALTSLKVRCSFIRSAA